MIYLDHNATTPMLPEVKAAMEPWWRQPANPSSVHRQGQRARAALESARSMVAEFLGRSPSGIVFTSGATEANQAWWHGQLEEGVRAFATARIEHPCVLGAAMAAMQRGATVQWLSTTPSGQVDLAELDPSVEAISLQAANHETGVLQPVSEALGTGLPVHVDATQAAGRVSLGVSDAHGVVISGHKLGGPTGIGVLSLPNGEAFPALLSGGTQERGRRAGTVNVAGAVGLAAACTIAQRERERRTEHWLELRGALEHGLRKLGATVVGAPCARVPQTTCAVLPIGPSELVVQALDLRGIAVSAGAACASGSQDASPVLLAMAHPNPDRSLRISMGPDTTHAEIATVLAALRDVLSTIDAADAY